MNWWGPILSWHAKWIFIFSERMVKAGIEIPLYPPSSQYHSPLTKPEISLTSTQAGSFCFLLQPTPPPSEEEPSTLCLCSFKFVHDQTLLFSHIWSIILVNSKAWRCLLQSSVLRLLHPATLACQPTLWKFSRLKIRLDGPRKPSPMVQELTAWRSC